ncbi:2-dehydro-3-deoxyglucarate aldolase [Pantoea cypripedii]|uniref:2-dehydro-3-deoxyglucarate aldolase n=1 Tax=Pantoea cypripedii TaxID=55209 RepID=A0A6B9GB13_PANCY|nr:2-dehydro-3-deoxyglucarate aldolase [Pantoea cypripedii]QGY33053.1 2-dehydro-3-deoxyglucarate aldolase [Pantoea cypripedii]
MERPVLPNIFRSCLRNGDLLTGCWCGLSNPITTEILGLAGFDWLLIDGEHSPNDIPSFVTQLMALKDTSSAAVVRPPSNDPVSIKRLLDIGFYNFMVPFVETAEEATLAVKSTRYPPEGIRGVSVSHRSNRYGAEADYFKQINHNISVMIQIESTAGISNIDEICQVEGVDAIFIGPSDLAAALGYLGQPDNLHVQQTIRHLIERCQHHRVAVGILAPIAEDARRYINWGVTAVAVGSDVGIFRGATQALINRYRQENP